MYDLPRGAVSGNSAQTVLVRFNHLARCVVNAHDRRVKYWEIIAENLSKAGFKLGLPLSD